MTTTRKVTTFEMEGGSSGGSKVTSSISRSGGGEVIMKGQTGGGSLEMTKVRGESSMQDFASLCILYRVESSLRPRCWLLRM